MQGTYLLYRALEVAHETACVEESVWDSLFANIICYFGFAIEMR